MIFSRRQAQLPLAFGEMRRASFAVGLCLALVGWSGEYGAAQSADPSTTARQTQTGAPPTDAGAQTSVGGPAAAPIMSPAAPPAEVSAPSTPQVEIPPTSVTAQPAGFNPAVVPALPQPPPAQSESGPLAVYPGLEVPPRTVPHRGGWNPWDHPEGLGGRTHDGFFLRLALGLGGSGLRGRRDPETGGAVTFSGLGLAGSVAVGGELTENLMLHGDLFFASMVDATVRGGIYDGAAREYDYDYDGDVSYVAPGMGLTYYLMPANVYFSGALGLANAVWERSDGERQASRLGLALNLLVGKEWWVDPQWGIGAAAQMLLMRAGDYHYDNVQALSVGLLFSATHN